MTRTRCALGIALLLVASSGCSSPAPRGDASYSGRWIAGSASQNVTFVVFARGDDMATIETVLGGEHFIGYIARIRQQGAPIITSIYNGWDDDAYAAYDWDPGWQGFEPVDYSTFVRAYSGYVIATLSSENGGAIRCNFEPVRPDRGALFQVRGRCQVSDGSAIHVGS